MYLVIFRSDDEPHIMRLTRTDLVKFINDAGDQYVYCNVLPGSIENWPSYTAFIVKMDGEPVVPKIVMKATYTLGD